MGDLIWIGNTLLPRGLVYGVVGVVVLAVIMGFVVLTDERRFESPEVRRLRHLVKHCWIHSGYQNCGYNQMTSEQKNLYDGIVSIPSDDLK